MPFAIELIGFMTLPELENPESLTQPSAILFRNLISKSDFLFPSRNAYISNFWLGNEMFEKETQ